MKNRQTQIQAFHTLHFWGFGPCLLRSNPPSHFTSGEFRSFLVFHILPPARCVMNPTLNCPCCLFISLSPSLFLHVYPLDPFLHCPTPPPNLIYFIGSSRRTREGDRGVQYDLLFPEARTSSYCGGHRLSAAPRSEHYSACFNDAHSGGRGRERKRRREWERETRKGEWMEMRGLGYFFPPTLFTPTPSPTFPPPLLLRKCTSLSTSILKGSSKLSNLSAILYIIACLNPHWNLGCYATIIWPLISSPSLHFLFHCFLSFQQGGRGRG